MTYLLDDFSRPEGPSLFGTEWIAFTDQVMGGVSTAEVRQHERYGSACTCLSGRTSLENNGGFSSVRTVGRSFDFSGATAVVLRVRGDGRSYQLRLATDARFRGITVSYGGEFGTEAGQWTEVRVPLADLRPSAHGFALQGPPLDASRIRELGLLIGDKREGPFRLEVDWIGVE